MEYSFSISAYVSPLHYATKFACNKLRRSAPIYGLKNSGFSECSWLASYSVSITGWVNPNLSQSCGAIRHWRQIYCLPLLRACMWLFVYCGFIFCACCLHSS